MHLCRIKSDSIIYQCISKTKAQIIFATRAWQVPLIIRLSLELNAMLWIQTRSDVSREADESPATRPSAVTTRVCAALLSLTRSASLTPVCAICRLRFVHPSRPVQSDRWRIFVLEWERMTTANWKWLMCVFVLSESKALRADVITHAPPAGRGRAMIIFWAAFRGVTYLSNLTWLLKYYFGGFLLYSSIYSMMHDWFMMHLVIIVFIIQSVMVHWTSLGLFKLTTCTFTWLHFWRKKQYFLLLTILFQLKKYITFKLYLMHIKYGKQKLKSACLTSEPMLIVFMHQAHTFLLQLWLSSGTCLGSKVHHQIWGSMLR